MSPSPLCPGLRATLVLLASFAQLTLSQRDPISDFCRRWGHQSAVVDDKLYIDGGLMTFSTDSSHENITNSWLIYHDLSAVADSGMPQPYANLSKNSTIPNVNGGILWPDTVNKRIYLYGGEFYEETPWDFSLFAYDVINDYWNDYGAPNNVDISRLSYGAGVSISSRGEGYYYGGWMNNNTSPNWEGASIPTSYMLVYDMDSNSWSNNTGPDDVGRAEGVMLYIPAGDGGMIVYFGGIQGAENGTWTAQPMDEIIIYDILSGKSYTQNATGDVPDSRRRFCAGVTWPDDQSSYNIYLYGGLGETEGSAGFDEAYILSLPTFTWIKIYPTTDGNGDYPHHSMTCNVVNNEQMIIHGGFFPETNDCDTPDQWGLHNLDMGKQNKDKSFWALYDPTKTEYVIPTEVISVVGGKSTGGATKTSPKDGWSNNDLKVLMTRTASVSARTATRDVGSDSSSTSTSAASSSNKVATGTIVGAAVGGAAGLALILAGVWFLLRRRKAAGATKDVAPAQQQQEQPPMEQTPQAPPAQKDSSYGYYGQNNSPGPWSPASTHTATTSPPPFQSTPPPGQPLHPHAGYAHPVELSSDNQYIAPVEMAAGDTNQWHQHQHQRSPTWDGNMSPVDHTPVDHSGYTQSPLEPTHTLNSRFSNQHGQ